MSFESDSQSKSQSLSSPERSKYSAEPNLPENSAYIGG
jgi:hypothetical protein